MESDKIDSEKLLSDTDIFYLSYIGKIGTEQLKAQLKDNKINNEAMKKSMMILLRSQIVGKCEDYQKRGFLPDYARSCLNDLYLQYTALGGNHGVNILVDKTLELPPVKEEK